MFVKKLFFLLLLGFVLHNASAQHFDPPLRLEFDISQSKYPVNVELLGENGLVFFFQKDAKEDLRWTISHYDTNFQLTNTKSIPFDARVSVSATGSNNNFFYAVLQSNASAKANATNTYILLYDIAMKKIDIFSFYHTDREKIRSISYFGDIFVFSTYNSKSEGHLYLFNNKEMNIKTFHKEIPYSCDFQDAYWDTVSHSLWIVTKFSESKKQTFIYLTQLNANGDILQDISIKSDNKYNLHSCRIVSANSGDMLLFGSYLQNEGSNFLTKNNNSGIFTAIITNNIVEQLVFFEYSMLDNWYSMHKKNLSNCFDISYFIAQNDSFFIIVSDFYSPEYQQQFYADRYASGIGFYPATAAETKLIGFKYQTACLLTFNKQGKLLWYNQLNYSGLLLKSVRPLLSGYIDSETNNTLYLFEYGNKIFSIVYDTTEIVQPIKTIPLLSSSRFENINSNEKSYCRHWYGSNFVCYAYQKTSKKYGSNSRNNSKSVFGVNKLVYN